MKSQKPGTVELESADKPGRLNPNEVTSNSSLIETLLAEQQSLTAVDRFVQHHERSAEPAQARYYRDLIPLTRPKPGQQYAFEVDLDRCSGCKACVSACHNMNGLDDGEMWRSVGLLFSQDWREPLQRTVTTACHHCADPGCLNGCPVLAYDKEPVTGIVRHLDDQCIGCQYCVMKCPYEVPKYSAERGIVRKCDMCSNRLAAEEAPACVQACPTQAIQIVIADRAQIEEAARGGEFLPEAPDPAYTKPSTRYKSSKPLPETLFAGDHARIAPAEAHLPLVFMLVISQLAVGAGVAAALADAGAAMIAPSRLLLAAIAAVAGTIAPAIASLHLGRPLKAWRAFLGWRTSWFSREVVVFGLFVPLAQAALAMTWLSWEWAAAPLRIAAALTGVAGVVCSAMIYVDTHREFWNARWTFGRFLLTTAVLGAGATVAGEALAARASTLLIAAAAVMAAGMIFKLSLENRIFRHLVSENTVRLNSLNRTARLLDDGVLGRPRRLRTLLGLLGGIVCPILLVINVNAVNAVNAATGAAGNPTTWIAFGLMALPLCLAGEFLERYLFFTAVVPVKMPGGIAA